jgi:uncharacterized membrane protein
MNAPQRTWEYIADPVWPWSLPDFGLPALIGVALVLAGLTIWTYRGVAEAGPRRVAVLVLVRLLALLLTLLILLRPSAAFQEELKVPSSLILVLDYSESMTIQDEYKSQSRWDALLATMDHCEPLLKKLRDESNVTIHAFRFAGDVGAFDPKAKPDGKRTDFGSMLNSLHSRFSGERNLRGLLVLSDGADNGTRFQALAEAAKWRSLSCPIHTFALGQTTTTSRQNDVAFHSITPEPSPVPVKGKLTVKAVVAAPGFETARVKFRLLMDDREVAVEDRVLSRSEGNEIKLTADAPASPGEIKVTLRADPLPGEVTVANNEISTYVTVVKEGISVLLVDKPRYYEPQGIVDALSKDPRFRIYTLWLANDRPSPDHARLFQFDRQHYDVIILGDVTAQRLSGGQAGVLEQINELVRSKGTGVLMMGGFETFGNGDWRGTPLADLSPVELNAIGQLDEELRVEPTDEGFRHYVLRLADKADENKALWKKLPPLEGITRLGAPKPGAIILALSDQGQRAGPILVAKDYGKGRTLAFAGDTTFHWQKYGQPDNDDGIALHARFWKQLAVWLAHQEDVEGNVWVKPDARRLAAGTKLGFAVGLRGKGGVDLDDARFDVTVLGPDQKTTPVQTVREQGVERGNFFYTDAAGEYRLVVRGRGKDADGSEVTGEATARFLVYQDDAEMMRQAADHDFLTRLAATTGGEFYRAEDLFQFLKDLQAQPLPQLRPRSEHWPDWDTNHLSPFLVGIFVAFVALICLEWLLRRVWGLV